MAEDRGELLQHFQTMRNDFLATIDGLTDDQLCEPTIDGWSVKDHLLHIALWDDVRASEVERISAACAVADRALATLLPEIRPGVTDADLALRLEWLMRTGSAEALSFDVTCLSGPEAALPHGSPGDRLIRDRANQFRQNSELLRFLSRQYKKQSAGIRFKDNIRN